MISMDTNILLYAYDTECPEHQAAIDYVRSQHDNPRLALSELVLVELYVLLRNPVILRHPLSAKDTVDVIQTYRANRHWYIIESAEGIMNDVWRLAGASDFPRRRIFDARLAQTLRRHGVNELATRNVDDFEGLGLERVWDPIPRS